MPEQLLLAEDDALLMALLRATFRDSGFELLEASTGAEALTLARANQPAVVLLDVGLPDVDGYAVCRALRDRADGRRPHVIILTARSSLLDRRRAADAGADAFMTKPFSPSALVAAVRDGCAPPA